MTRTKGWLLCLLAVLALLALAAPVQAEDGEGKEEEDVDSALALGHTGDFPGIYHDTSLGYLDANGAILDLQELSTAPGMIEEEPAGANFANGHVYFFNNDDGGDFAFVDLFVAVPLMLDGRVCPNGFRKFDLGGNERIEDAILLNNSVIGVGRMDNNILLVEIDLATCQLGTRFGGDGVLVFPDIPNTSPDRARALTVVGQNLVFVGRSGDDAIVVKTDLDGVGDPNFGNSAPTKDGVLRYNPTAPASTRDNLRDVLVSGASIFAVGQANENAGGGAAVDSLVAKVNFTTGAVEAGSGPRNLGGTQEGLEAVQLYVGDLYAAGSSRDDDSRAGTVARFNLNDLSLDTGCDPSGASDPPGTGIAFYDFGDDESRFRDLGVRAALFPFGWIDRGEGELRDHFELRLGPDCVIDATYAGGAQGNSFGFIIGAPPIGVIQPSSQQQQQQQVAQPGAAGQPAQAAVPTPEASFQALELRSFLSRLTPEANAVISGIQLNCPPTGAPGLGDRCIFDVSLDERRNSSDARQAQRRRRRALRFAGGRATVPEGQRRNVRLRLTRKGRRALARRRRARRRSVRARLTLKVRNNAGQRRTFRRNVTLRLKRR